jgi:phosphatidylserine/phosphatidylglycerophosphate/cardiolipin synthase-like enzyme
MPNVISPVRTLHITEPFIQTLETASGVKTKDDPRYYASSPRQLISTSTVHSFGTGTGSALYNSLLPLLESTAHELILVTCFWARSSTLNTLNSLLRKLSDKAVRRGTEKIKVRLCFSSSSLFQKLFHKQSVTGQTYDSSVWVKKLGLPPPNELGGLDLKVKSVFMLPFSVMHPKFMIVDRQVVALPSCNISWEEWFEGCITLSGPIVNSFLQFHKHFWERREFDVAETAAQPATAVLARVEDGVTGIDDRGHGHVTTTFSSKPGSLTVRDIPTIFLPSPHRRNPRFQPFAPTDKVLAPPTPLNTFVLTLLEKAEKSIRIQTPNLTAAPVLSCLLRALSRGIDVQILTSERLMMLEQLVTAGTTTSRCVKTLIKRYKKLLTSSPSLSTSDEEAAISAPRIGALHIAYFASIGGPKSRGQEADEPQQSHLKMMIVDEEVLVLGSGNLDRASWFTSQELGVAFFDKGLVERVASVVDEAMQGRSRVVFDSGVDKLCGEE